MTHTYATLTVSSSAHAEIVRLLTAAGYDHAFHGGVIDMHGIGLTANPEELYALVPEGDNVTTAYNCKECAREVPEGELARYARLAVLSHPVHGIAVKCLRHNLTVVTIDLLMPDPADKEEVPS